MAAAPYYLLAVGIVVIITGVLVANMTGGQKTLIDPRMSDKEIARQMKRNQGSSLGGVLMLVGWLIVAVSIIWRIVRIFA